MTQCNGQSYNTMNYRAKLGEQTKLKNDKYQVYRVEGQT